MTINWDYMRVLVAFLIYPLTEWPNRGTDNRFYPDSLVCKMYHLRNLNHYHKLIGNQVLPVYLELDHRPEIEAHLVVAGEKPNKRDNNHSTGTNRKTSLPRTATFS